MKNILLACFGGFSTSMLVQKMRVAAQERGLDLNIKAVGESAVAENIESADVLLFGPQAGYLIDDFKDEYPETPMAVIDQMTYGSMNGSKVLDLAFATAGE